MVNCGELRYSLDRFKQVKYRKSDSYFGVFLSLIVAPAFIGLLTWQVYENESKVPYTMTSEQFTTSSVFEEDAFATFICQSPTGCFYRQSYSKRGITSRCGNTGSKGLVKNRFTSQDDDPAERWVYVRYRDVFQVFACNSPNPQDGVLVAHMNRPFHSQCGVYENKIQRRNCVQRFLTNADAEGFQPCDVQHSSSRRMQALSDQIPLMEKTKRLNNPNKERQADCVSCDAAPPKVTPPKRYLDVKCHDEEKLLPGYYRYEGNGTAEEPILDPRYEDCTRMGTCDYTMSAFPMGVAFTNPIMLDADSIFSKQGAADSKGKENALASEAAFCRNIVETRIQGGNEQALYYIPLFYGSHVASFRKLTFQDYKCTGVDGDDFLFSDPRPNKNTSVNHVLGFFTTPTNTQSGVIPMDASEYLNFLAITPDFKNLVQCMQGETLPPSRRCGNERLPASAQMLPTAARQNNTLLDLYKDDPRKADSTNPALWSDPEFLEKQYMVDHLAITRIQFLSVFQKQTIVRKDIVALLLVVVGGYLSLVLVGGRMLTMVYAGVLRSCCGMEMDAERHPGGNKERSGSIPGVPTIEMAPSKKTGSV